MKIKEESTYDYLVILTNAGGELSLDESRLAVHEAKADKKNTSLLVTNGFATLFLVFHPYYAMNFRFTRVAITIAILLGPTANVAFLVALAFAVAASANLPVIVLSMHRKFKISRYK